jgi:hypothetical protein
MIYGPLGKLKPGKKPQDMVVNQLAVVTRCCVFVVKMVVGKQTESRAEPGSLILLILKRGE